MGNLVKINDLTPKQIASICDHTYLNRDEAFRLDAKKSKSGAVELREKDFMKFMKETIGYAKKGFTPYAICVRPEDVLHAKRFLDENDSDIKIASVVGFPNGCWYRTPAKTFETVTAAADGATEIDMVLNYKRLMEGDIDYVRNDIQRVVDAAHSGGAILKVILETSELEDDYIIQACNLSKECGADFVKTSTGFASGGASAHALEVMKQYFKKGGVKMSGGVNADNVKDLLYAASGRDDGYISLDPMKIRIGESSLLKALTGGKVKKGSY